MTNPNDPAFPSKFKVSTLSDPIEHIGLTKREFFAALIAATVHNRVNSFTSLETQQEIATEAVEMADALIKELSK